MVIHAKWNWICAAGATCALLIIYLLYSAFGTYSGSPFSARVPSAYHFEYDIWPAFQHQASSFSHEWFKSRCIRGQVNFSIEHLDSILNTWETSSDNDCRVLLSKLQTVYSFDTRHASLRLPTPFESKVRKWLGDDEVLYNEVFDQEVIHVVNQFTREHTIFNPLRDKRPVMLPDEPELLYYQRILNKTKNSCDFCNYNSFTAEHVFHRVESKLSFSASNIFKMDTLHALFAMKQHDPLFWSLEQYMDLMSLTNLWFEKAASHVVRARFPVVIWDVLPKCGASQVHPHLHGFLDTQRYHGVVEAWRHAAQDYYHDMGSNFFADMANIAVAMGLGVAHKSAVAFASLVPRKDHEIVVMAPAADKDFFEMVFVVLRALIDDLGKFCFSMGMGYPPLEGQQGRIPAFARIITRGTVTEIRTDISSLELFAATNVNVDPYKVVQLIQESYRKWSRLFNHQ